MENYKKIIGVILLGAGGYVAYKNYKKPGFWGGIGAGFLIGWGANVLTSKK